jgi:hypothetical protein
MLSRALIIATVTILIGCITAVGVRAQENLDRGKSPSQIFSGTCSACHKSPRGLLKNVQPSSLPGFLRQHYTTGSEMASLLAGFLISNGAADARYQQKDQPRQKGARQDPGQDARPDQPDRFGRRQQPAAPATETSRTEPDGVRPQGEAARPGRDSRRQAKPTAAPDANRPVEGQAPVQAATDSKQGTKQQRSKRAKQEPPKAEEAAPGDAGKNEPSSDAARIESGKPDASRTESPGTDSAKTDAAETYAPKSDAATDGVKTEAARSSGEAVKPAGEANKPAVEAKSDTTKVEAPSEPAPVRPDPAPSAPSAPPPSTSTGGTSEPAASPSAAAPPAATATAPAPPSPSPSGPPVPPISR